MTRSRLPPSKRERQRWNRLGRRAEWIAAAWLMVRGYRILARGFKVQDGEIDIVALRGSILAFVEVKARPSLDEALLAVTPTKQRRIRRAASVWLSRNGWAMTFVLRGDVVLAAPGHWPRHVENVFELRIG